MLTEDLSNNDKAEIRGIIRDEIKKYFEAKSNVKNLTDKVFKDGGGEEKSLEISRNALIQFYKSIWLKKDFWTSKIINSRS